jgi:hypothetical protein
MIAHSQTLIRQVYRCNRLAQASRILQPFPTAAMILGHSILTQCLFA